MTDCLFCRVAAKELDSEIVYESDDVVAFKDINPAAPIHLLVIPRRHLASAHELSASDGPILGEIFEVIGNLAKDHDVADGHRIVSNVGAQAGQSVPHLHFHLLGGRDMSWPPG